MLISRDSFLARSLKGLINILRETLEKGVELPRNIKQACLLSLDMVYVALAIFGDVRIAPHFFRCIGCTTRNHRELKSERPQLGVNPDGLLDVAHDANRLDLAPLDVWLQAVVHVLQPHVQRGEVTTIRVVRDIQKTVRIDPQLRAFGFQFPVSPDCVCCC